MNQREAKRLACAVASAYIQNCVDSGAETFDELSDSDAALCGNALQEVIAELWRRGLNSQWPAYHPRASLAPGVSG